MTINGANVTYTADPDADEEFNDVFTFPSGPNNCAGTMALFHGPRGDPISDLKIKLFSPGNYRRTGRAFRRRTVLKAEVWGSCTWYVNSGSRFRGTRMTLFPGFNSYLDFTPKSIKNVA